jgi:hypothetical protein
MPSGRKLESLTTSRVQAQCAEMLLTMGQSVVALALYNLQKSVTDERVLSSLRQLLAIHLRALERKRSSDARTQHTQAAAAVAGEGPGGADSSGHAGAEGGAGGAGLAEGGGAGVVLAPPPSTPCGAAAAVMAPQAVMQAVMAPPPIDVIELEEEIHVELGSEKLGEDVKNKLARACD